MAVSDRPSVPILAGPTACGKTAIALRLAEEFPLEVISADSRQVVRHLQVGTAKPTAEERARVPVHLIDLVEPGQRYSAFQFIGDAERCIGQILSRQLTPLVVGGTGLYLRALTEGVVEVADDDLEIRRTLEEELALHGPDEMYRRLQQVDPLEAARTHPANRLRVLRALEIFHLTGKSKSEITATGPHRRSGYQFVWFVLLPERRHLYERINQRVDAMIAAGWLDEVTTLVEAGKADALRQARVIGYAELLDFLQGLRPWDETISLIKQNTRRYAKRQYTWFNHQVPGRKYTTAEAVLTEMRSFLTGNR